MHDMKKSIILLLIFTCALKISSQGLPQYSKTDLLVQFKPNASFEKENCIKNNSFRISELDILNNTFGLDEIQLTGNRHTKDTYLLRFKEEVDIPNLIEKYSATDLFSIVEPNFIGQGHSVIPNDQYFFRQYGLLNNGTLTSSLEDADIDMELAWDIQQGDESIVVAILDTGLKMDHPEFDGRLWINEDESAGENDDDGNGFVGDVLGWDFANVDNDPSDDYGHGTNVTGILGATGNNGIGYAGVDWNCKLMICKILGDDNYGLYSWWTDAIYYAVDNGAKVLNMSVGGSGYSSIMQQAAEYAYLNGVTIVVSMGNENRLAPSYPAAYSTTIGVGSTNNNDHRTEPFFWDETSGSNFGPHIDVVAPGNFIYGLQYQSNSNYHTYWGGTSQAAPLVAGLSSLLMAQDPSRTPDDIRSIIRNTAEDQVGNVTEDTEGFDIYYGHGRVNAFAALSSMPVATQDNSKSERFSIYPNPSTSKFVLEISPEIDAIRIFNNQGKFVHQIETQNSQEKVFVDLESNQSGVYLIQALDTDNGTMRVKKVILQK